MQRVLYASVIAMGCTIAVAAQSGMTADQGKDKMMAKDAAKSVAVTGCVAEADGHFMLNNATMADQSGAPMSYALTGGTLKPHVGHKMEIMGMMKPMAAKDMKKDNMAMGKDSMPKEPMAKDPMAKDTMPHDMKKMDMPMSGTIAVKEVKMIAATCS